jgi:hypothetical protein
MEAEGAGKVEALMVVNVRHERPMIVASDRPLREQFERFDLSILGWDDQVDGLTLVSVMFE